MTASIQDLLSATDPLPIFKSWYDLAVAKAPSNPESEATAMVLSTVNEMGHPSSRVVLLKELNDQGFVFFTNYDSQKGRQFLGNPHLAVTFHWPHLTRQVNIRGVAEKTSRTVSENYWRSRPRGSQISQSISLQSQPLNEGQDLVALYQNFERQHEGHDIPCPPHWGGVLIRPHTIEFWLGKNNRLHERVQFLKSDLHWDARQLFP
jgi:pyridoxamine 5'-phosphate oxidase